MTEEAAKEHRESGWAYEVVLNDLGMCGCGMYDERLGILKEVMNAFPLYEGDNVPGYLRTALGEWFLCLLDKAELIEHGTSIGGSWLTDKGERFLKAINDESIWSGFINDSAMSFCECPECNKE